MLALLLVFASMAIFIGCQEQQSVITPDPNQVSLPKFSLPAGETLVSAKLYMWGYTHATSVPHVINIHKVTSDWQETTVTWNSFGGAYNSVVSTSFTANTANVYSPIDVTSLVQGWLDGETNYGILLKNRDIITNDNYAKWSSKDGYEYPPYLEIVTTSGTSQLNVLADAYLRELNPDNNYGLHVFNYSGFEGEPAKEKQTLMRFDIEPTPQVVSCETSYAFDGDNLPGTVGTCFNTMGFGNWGWSIKLPGPGSYTKCDITKGTKVGTLTANYTNGTVAFTYNFYSGFSSSETHFYAGKTPTPLKKGKPTVAPGQYYITPNLVGEIYIIAHAVVCSNNWR